MPAIMKIAETHNLKVMEDCAQSHGASINGQVTGTFGHAASFSFYPGKNLGAYGDAGCMATNDEALAAKLRMIANHGQKGKHNHLIEGRNSRLDGLQAAILSAKLPHLSQWTESRIAHAETYNRLLADSGMTMPVTRHGCRHVFHLYVIRSEQRDALASHLKDAGIDTAVHYPTALPFLPCYRDRGFRQEDFPVAFHNQSRILSLPMYAELSADQLEKVASVILSFAHVPVQG
jgi:dTDP-4-amino-4,6-dideoxygalactose transaminase